MTSETNKLARPQEVRFLTPLRGIAALLVAVFHGLARLDSLGEAVGEQTAFFERGYLWVDLFFLLSGFVLAHVYADRFAGAVRFGAYASFLKARFARVYPLHLFILLIYIGMAVALSIKTSDWSIFDTPNKSTAAILTNLFLVHSMGVHEQLTWNGPSWSISTEWHAYVLFPMIALVCNRTWKQVVLFCVSAVVLVVLYQGRGNLDITFDYGFLRCISEFSIGLVINRVAFRGQWLRSARPWYVLVTALLIGFTLNAGETQVGDIWIIPLFAVLILTLAVYEGNWLAWLESRAMVWLGETSYSIYMTHFFILAIATRVGAVVMPEYTSFNGQGLVFLVAYLLVVLAISSATYVILEKPARNLIRRGFAASWRREAV